ncbi:MAG: acyl carrier protein [Bacteroidota bacterium]
MDLSKKQISREDIQQWLTEKLAEELKTSPESIDIKAPFVDYGLNSLATVSIQGDLEDWLEIDLEPTILWDYPSIEAVAKYLESEINYIDQY